MNESSAKKVYVWEDIKSVDNVSIIDNNGNEIICPVTANAKNIASNLSYEYNEVENKKFTDAIQDNYYYKNRNGQNYKLNSVDQIESFSVNYFMNLCIDMDFNGRKNKNSNARGWARSSKFYFNALMDKYPGAIIVNVKNKFTFKIYNRTHC